MTRWDKTKEALGKAVYALDCLLLAAALALAVGVLVRTVRLETFSLGRMMLHRNLAAGFFAFFLLFLLPRVRGNTRWMMKFTHEFTHLFFALLFFRKIHRFNVDDRDSHVSFGNGWFGYLPITLSPYCIPLYTLALLPWHFTSDKGFFLAFIDLLIGFTYAFHVCCWLKQTRLHQTDITGPGTVRSLLFIAFFQTVGLCLVLLTPSSGVQLALQRVFIQFPTDILHSIFA